MKVNKLTKLMGLLVLGASFTLASCSPENNNSSAASSSSSQSGQDSEKDADGLTIINDPQGYTGSDDFSELSWKEKTKITAALEQYAVDNFIGGIPLYDDSSSIAISQRVTPKSQKYITNYGFGMMEGKMEVDGKMYNGSIVESRAKYRSYYHSYTNTDSGTFNGWSSTGSDVSDRHSMISSGYFGVVMDPNESSGYRWVGELSRDSAPTMLDIDGNEISNPTNEQTSTKWRVYLHVGEGYAYQAVAGSKWENSEYDGLTVSAEDYITPFKAMLDNRLTRYSDLVSDASGIAGAKEYVYKTHDENDKWEDSGVGVQINTEKSSKDYVAIDFTFNQAKGVSSARTSLSSSLYSPLPNKFLKAIGGAKEYGVRSTGASAFDKFLCFGAYTPVEWESNSELIYEKNKSYFAADRYSYDGYVEKVYTNSATADEDAWRDFKENKLDECTVPISALKTDLPAYRAEHSDKILQTEGSTIIKINLNTTNEEEWNYFFGPNGKVYTHTDGVMTKGTGKWNGLKYIMSNKNFLRGFYFAIDRASLAETAGRKAALGYLSNAYMIDPTGSVTYRGSDEGKAVINSITEAAGNEYGYNKSVAESFFKKAGEELIKQGYYDEGDTIQIQGTYRYQSTIDNLGKYIKTDVADTFNRACKDLGLTLEIKLEVGGTSYTDTYTVMDHGEFDFAEGAITGNVLDPLNFMSTCSSTSALNQGFCLNWGRPTDHMSDNPVVYGTNEDGTEAHWSYDALWNMSQGFTVAEGGVATSLGNNMRFIGPGQTEESTGKTAESKEILFLFDCPEAATYTQKDVDSGLVTEDKIGEYKYDFTGVSDFGFFPQNDAGTVEGGYYFQGASAPQNSSNGYVFISLPLNTVKGYCETLATATSPITSFTVQFYLVYKVYPGTTREKTKTMIMTANTKLSALGIDPITK